MIMNGLFKNKKGYGAKYKEHLFEQYRLFVESVEKTSDRRQQANNYFIAINTAIISIIGLSFQTKIFDQANWLKSLLALLGLIICIIFWFLIRSYRQLNTGKFAVIHEIEEQLPLSLYKYEWKLLGEGKDKNKYYPFSHIELLIPWIFGIIYALMGFYFIIAAPPPPLLQVLPAEKEGARQENQQVSPTLPSATDSSEPRENEP